MGKTIAQLTKKVKDINGIRLALKMDRELKEKSLNKELVKPVEEQLRAAKQRVITLLNDEFDARHQQIMEQLGIAEKELADAKIALGNSDQMVGKIFCRWETRRWAGSQGKFLQTDDRGIVAVFNNDVQTTYNCRPGVGDLYIRNLKKDGTPGAKAVGRVDKDGSGSYGWFIEGLDPNKTEGV